MNITELMKEASLEIDDVRWYLSVEMAKKLIILKDEPIELVNFIHSKEMEAELYDTEQRFLDQLQYDLDKKKIDEVDVREALYNINRERIKRLEKRTSIGQKQKK